MPRPYESCYLLVRAEVNGGEGRPLEVAGLKFDASNGGDISRERIRRRIGIVRRRLRTDIGHRNAGIGLDYKPGRNVVELTDAGKLDDRHRFGRLFSSRAGDRHIEASTMIGDRLDGVALLLHLQPTAHIPRAVGDPDGDVLHRRLLGRRFIAAHPDSVSLADGAESGAQLPAGRESEANRRRRIRVLGWVDQRDQDRIGVLRGPGRRQRHWNRRVRNRLPACPPDQLLRRLDKNDRNVRSRVHRPLTLGRLC